MASIWNWLVTRWNWPGAAAFCGVALLVISPVVWIGFGPAIFWVFVQLPFYMLHQLEEHAGDRFRMFANQVIGGGTEVLSRRATFVINSVGVWGVDLTAIYLAILVSPGWGLVAMYLPLVNSVMHVGQALLLRRYNPGLITAIVLFIPGATLGIFVVCSQVAVSWTMQISALATAIAIHALIIVHVKRMLKHHAR
ncbi:MAG: HXXEE domain-containing protein [Chthoniobacterales bacterium]